MVPRVVQLGARVVVVVVIRWLPRPLMLQLRSPASANPECVSGELVFELVARERKWAGPTEGGGYFSSWLGVSFRPLP